MKLKPLQNHFLFWSRPFVKNFHFNLFILSLFALFAESSYAQAPVPPPGTNLQSWMGNTFSVFTDLDLQERVPEEGFRKANR